jgi:aspartate kinase
MKQNVKETRWIDERGTLSRARIVVVKFGGSLLRGLRDYRACAAHLARRLAAHPDDRVVAVVSARYGVTQRLARLAQAMDAEPDATARDLLWSTGETYSAAVLTLALQGAGVDATCLGPHETGLYLENGDALHCVPERVSDRFAIHSVVVVPGFVAPDCDGRLRSLGRGGSDLTAVTLADALAADRCEIVKDVAGYFTQDPHTSARATPIRELSYDEAMRKARSGCGVVQAAALARAAKRGVVLHVRDLAGEAPGTWVRREVKPADRRVVA